MSGSKKITVTRAYRHQPDECLRALITLLKKPVSNEGSPALAALKDTRGETVTLAPHISMRDNPLDPIVEPTVEERSRP